MSDASTLAVAESRLTLADLREWARQTWPGRLAAMGSTWLGNQERLVYNRLSWPVGSASQFAYGHFLCTDADLAVLQSSFPGPLTLVLNDGNPGRNISVPMYALPPRPLGANLTGGDQYLLTLVDQRYFWWDKAATIAVTAGVTTWTSLFAALGAALGVGISVSSIPAAYLMPPADFNTNYDSLPPQLDAAARSVGMRVVVGLNGAVSVLSASAAQALLAADLASVSKLSTNPLNPLVAGGSINLDGPGVLPAFLSVAFPDVTNGTLPLWRSTQVTTACPVAAGTYPATKLMRSSLVNGPSNGAQVAALALQAATDWYNWAWYAEVDAAYNGVCPWNPTGFEDRIEWTHQAGAITMRVQRPAWNIHEEFLLNYGTWNSITADPKTLIAKTTSTISALSGSTPGSGPATVYAMVAGALTSTTDSITVFNKATSAIAPGTWVNLVLEPVSGDWFIIDGMAPSQTAVAKLSSVLPATTGGTPGSGTATLQKMSGGALVTQGLADVTVYNDATMPLQSGLYVNLILEPVSGLWFVVGPLYSTTIAKLTSNVTARSGTTIGSGTADLEYLSGSTLTTRGLTGLTVCNNSSVLYMNGTYVNLIFEPISGSWFVVSVFIPTAIAKLTSTVNPISGSSLGSGTATQYSNVGGTLTTTGVSLTVYNDSVCGYLTGDYVNLILDPISSLWMITGPEQVFLPAGSLANPGLVPKPGSSAHAIPYVLTDDANWTILLTTLGDLLGTTGTGYGQLGIAGVPDGYVLTKKAAATLGWDWEAVPASTVTTPQTTGLAVGYTTIGAAASTGLSVVLANTAGEWALFICQVNYQSNLINGNFQVYLYDATAATGMPASLTINSIPGDVQSVTLSCAYQIPNANSTIQLWAGGPLPGGGVLIMSGGTNLTYWTAP
jgi:hypothetical protein